MVLEYRKRRGIAMNEVIIQAQDLVKVYKSKKGIFSSRKEEVKALDHVSFEIKKGQIVGLIGEYWLWKNNCRKSSSQFAASRWRKGNISGKMYL